MDKLNEKQRKAVWIAIFVAIGMFVYQPRIGNEFYLPRLRFLWDIFGGGVNYGQLVIQYLLLGVVTWAVVTSLKSKGD